MLFEDEKNKKITYMDKKFKISRSHCYNEIKQKYSNKTRIILKLSNVDINNMLR